MAEDSTVTLVYKYPIEEFKEEYIPDTIARKSDILEQVQVDWNQNDENAIDYIKNRPFYTTDPVDVTLVDAAAIEVESVDSPIINPFSIKLEVGNTYRVTFDDVEYNCVAFSLSGLPGIGNKKFAFGEDTGEPFLIVYQEGAVPVLLSSEAGTIMLFSSEIGSHSITIIEEHKEIVQLDEKYISYTAGRKVANKGAEIFNDYDNNIATGSHAHAEGSHTTASGFDSHAEGSGTTASGYSSHAEGGVTIASGENSHTEGNETVASGENSHAEGNNTIASGNYQHAQGIYNINDVDADGNALNTYAHIVGNGTSDTARSNAHTLDWSGNAWYAGSVEGTALILSSPNGTRFTIAIGDDGVLTAT